MRINIIDYYCHWEGYIVVLIIMIDPIDQKIIELLFEDARQSSDALANTIGVDSSTIRRRINKLIKKGALTFTININPVHIGLPVIIVLALDVVPERLSEVEKILRSRKEVRMITPTIGRFDIMAIVWFASNESIHSFIEGVIGKLEGIRNTETFICLSKYEDSILWK